jgi:sugar lactone lactonase YvrE
MERSMPETFSCPSCGAPLDYKSPNEPVIECSFCGNKVIVPAELQSRPDKQAVFASSFGSEVTGQQIDAIGEIAAHLAAGRKIEAVKLYRETFGVGLKEAKEAVDTLQKTGMLTVTGQRVNVALSPTSTGSGRRAIGCIIAAVVVVIVGATVLPLLIPALAVVVGLSATDSATELVERAVEEGGVARPTPRPTPTPIPTPAYTRFGREGIAPGQFTDARRIAIDGEGYIYVGEWGGGRIQRFDPSGQFDSFWMVDPDRPVTGLAANRTGVVYVVQATGVVRFNGADGEALGDLPDGAGGHIDGVAVAPDGQLVAVQWPGQIVRLDAQGNPLSGAATINLRELDIDTTFPPGADVLALDGLGYLYILDSTNQIVMKFGPEWQYLDKFGGKGEGPGQFRSPDSLAIDTQGRIYVGESRRIQIFDRNGNYLDEIPFDGLAFGMAINNRDELYVASRTEFLKFDLKR